MNVAFDHDGYVVCHIPLSYVLDEEALPVVENGCALVLVDKVAENETIEVEIALEEDLDVLDGIMEVNVAD